VPRIKYVDKNFRASTISIIEQANNLIDEYREQGYTMTLRQLYYRLVAAALIPNREESYKNLGSIVNDARLAGMIDWEMIEDRTRGVETISSWDSPSDIIRSCVRSYKIDLWKNQPYRVECWIEKEALAGVFARVCEELRVPYLSCRGYTSQSEMWRASERLKEYVEEGKTAYIIHFGDHDPSGIDMSRDIEDRLNIFNAEFEFKRIALNMDQIEEHAPPPNPAKTTDSRFASYIDQFGDESWELDALEPAVLAELVRTAVEEVLDRPRWNRAVREENEHKRLLGKVEENWEDITKDL
jgi:hypothetical protein